MVRTFLLYEEARTVVQELGITRVREYQHRYQERPGLPSTPPKTYPEWTSWRDFLAPKPAQSGFLSYEEASNLAAAVGMGSFREYVAEYRRYPGLPSTPNKTYARQWQGWRDFLQTR